MCNLILKCAELKIDYASCVITGFSVFKIFIECIDGLSSKNDSGSIEENESMICFLYFQRDSLKLHFPYDSWTLIKILKEVDDLHRVDI